MNYCLFLDVLVDPIAVTVSPKVLYVPLNKSAQFTCTAKSDADYSLKWTLGMYGALPEGAVDENGVLKFENTQGIHEGTYTCTGKNSFTNDMASAQLRVGGKKMLSSGLLKVRKNGQLKACNLSVARFTNHVQTC